MGRHSLAAERTAQGEQALKGSVSLQRVCVAEQRWEQQPHHLPVSNILHTGQHQGHAGAGCVSSGAGP